MGGDKAGLWTFPITQFVIFLPLISSFSVGNIAKLISISITIYFAYLIKYACIFISSSKKTPILSKKINMHAYLIEYAYLIKYACIFILTCAKHQY